MTGHMGSMMRLPILLVTMAVGYWVCVKAEGQKGFLKELGYWIGSIIIVASVILALCKPFCRLLFKNDPCADMPYKGKLMHKGATGHEDPMCGFLKE